MPGSDRKKSVVIIGLGNVGSQAAPLIARNKAVGHLCLIDADCYADSNLSSQNILPADTGMPKVQAVARRLHAMRPDLEIRQYAKPVAAMPLGKLRADVIVCCVDNRAGRQRINEAAWRLGVPWIDTGVDGDNWLVRVAVFVPGNDSVCGECGWTDDDYALLESGYPCQGEAESYATNATPELGALAGSLAAGEVRKLLDGDTRRVLAGRQLLLDVRHHRHYVATLPYTITCRFNHSVWKINALAQSAQHLTIAEALALGPGDGDAALTQDGQFFVSRLTCVACGWRSEPGWTLSERISTHQRICRQCGGRALPAAFDQEAELDAEVLSESWRGRSLSRLGYRNGDVFSLTTGEHVIHLELEG
jgi:adenylyltransferase/sulfurtransferase